MNTLESIIHRCRSGETVLVQWAELRPFFQGRTDKSRYEAAFDWATANRLSATASDIKYDYAESTISATLTFWDSSAKK